MDGPGQYTPPPRMSPPPADWRPQRLVPPVAPRRLPDQPHAAIDADEDRAEALTRIVGVVTGVVLVVLLGVICGRTLF